MKAPELSEESNIYTGLIDKPSIYFNNNDRFKALTGDMAQSDEAIMKMLNGEKPGKGPVEEAER